jgi:hypothetical protein
MKKANKSERGQVIILLTIGIITLLGFTALAIDGGRLYSERRFIQGVADTSSLTGALYIAQYDGVITSSVLDKAIQSALKRAELSGFDSTKTTVTITQDGYYYYVKTVINSTLDPIIAQIVYNGPLNVGARTVAGVSRIPVFALGKALVAINNTACRSIYFHGNANVNIADTGIYSYSTCPTNAIEFQGSTTADIAGYISAIGGVVIQKPENVVSDGVISENQFAFPEMSVVPSCEGFSNQSDSGSTRSPGIYPNGIHLKGNGTWELKPGLYCLDGDFVINNGTLVGHGVTLYMRNGQVSINGGAVELTAPLNNQWEDGADKPWNGMLIFYAYDNPNPLIMNGNADSYFEGTIYNHYGECQLNGGGNTEAFDAQVVCDTIDLIGNADLNMIYNPATKYFPPIIVDLVE